MSNLAAFATEIASRLSDFGSERCRESGSVRYMALDGWEIERRKRAAAAKALEEWAKNNARRDELIRRAVAAGLTGRDIQAITGIARTTIARITPIPRYRRNGPEDATHGPEAS